MFNLIHITKLVFCRVKLKEGFSYLGSWEIERNYTYTDTTGDNLHASLTFHISTEPLGSHTG